VNFIVKSGPNSIGSKKRREESERGGASSGRRPIRRKISMGNVEKSKTGVTGKLQTAETGQKLSRIKKHSQGSYGNREPGGRKYDKLAAEARRRDKGDFEGEGGEHARGSRESEGRELEIMGIKVKSMTD